MTTKKIKCTKCGEILIPTNKFVQCSCKATFVDYIGEGLYRTTINGEWID